MSLDKRIAFVTGGSRGIGAAIVRRLAADGAVVVFTYAASEARALALVAEVAAAGGIAQAVQADNADAAAVSAAIAAVAGQHGRIDILVNNAGILIRGADASVADFDRIVGVNVRGVFVASQAAVQHMGQGGRVITIGSVNGDRAGFEGAALYSMTKSAVAGLMRGMARDLGPRGITANTVQPGPTETEIVSDEVTKAFLRTMIPVGRMGQDSEIASLVAFLAGPQAAFINGAALTIDGGYLA
ncbi:SDR family oxidoreductase [Janthinobacterium sp.]|uniref:SDR family oxidoreductase n=1 Tax=Janthinobacterium sp. TaxID=1871054 RepID=UPI00260B3BC6|nr:SDR family oxidoreductase [Janthinobacterium sp.]